MGAAGLLACFTVRVGDKHYVTFCLHSRSCVKECVASTVQNTGEAV